MVKLSKDAAPRKDPIANQAATRHRQAIESLCLNGTPMSGVLSLYLSMNPTSSRSATCIAHTTLGKK